MQKTLTERVELLERKLGIEPQPARAPARNRPASLPERLNLEALMRAAAPFEGTAAELRAKTGLEDKVGLRPFATMVGMMAIRTRPDGLSFEKRRRAYGTPTWLIQTTQTTQTPGDKQ